MQNLHINSDISLNILSSNESYLKLENELKEEWLNIKDGGDFSLIEKFAQKLNSLSIEKDIYILKDYSNELLKNIEAFDIEKVDYLMNSYMELINNLKVKLGN